MNDHFDCHAALSDWKAFNCGDYVCKNTRPEIFDSWIRCQKAGIDPSKETLSTSHYDKAIQIYEEDWVYGQTLTMPYLKNFYKLLQDTDSAIFYISKDLLVISQRGSKPLLEALNAKNIGIGTDLNENISGTNAAALTYANPKGAWVTGAEHFIKAFHEFSCSTVPYARQASIHPGYIGYIMFITSKDNFSPLHLGIVRQFGDLLSSTILFKLQQVNSKLLNAYMENGLMTEGRNGLIVTDHRGIVLHTNAFIKNQKLLGGQIIGSDFLTSFPELSIAMSCISSGKPIYLQEVTTTVQNKPFSFFMDCLPINESDQCIGMIVTLQEKKRIHRTITKLANYTAQYSMNDLIGSSPEMASQKTLIKLAAKSPANVLITGETGTGKELVAHSIHNASDRSAAPFVSLNCAAIPRELIGSELFGYVEGAFTGARKGGAVGKFELADKGTVFLDEIGDMPMDLQSILLRVLEEKKVTRIGGDQQIPIDVKIIAATNKNLLKLVEDKEFRLDLYYRLNVIKIDIPPLRARKEDIPSLVHSFIKDFNKSLNKNITGLTNEAMEFILSYDWPGNVRELRNIIERAVNLCSASKLSSSDLPSEILPASYFIKTNCCAPSASIIDSYRSFEEQKILSLMIKYNGNKSQVAKEMGISRSTLYSKLKEINYERLN